MNLIIKKIRFLFNYYDIIWFKGGFMTNFICRKISVDSVYNDPVDVRCGGPVFLGCEIMSKDWCGEDYNKWGKKNDIETP